MSPRIVGCLLLSIIAAMAAFAWVLSAGWGILLALVAYAFVGSLVLVLAAAAAAALQGWRETPPRPAPPRSGRRFATAHSG